VNPANDSTPAIANLEVLLYRLSTEVEGCEPLREHLESAKLCLAGRRWNEYLLSLALVRENLNCVSDPDLRSALDSFLDHEMELTLPGQPS
jgi:hypothetical protein